MRFDRLTLLLCGCAWLTSACGDDDASSSSGLECGAGTVQVDGSCVPESELGCGKGTVEKNGDCVPAEQRDCGAGTHEEDGSCVPDVAPEIECWEGTVRVGGACVPDGSACDQGTVFDEATGRCELDPDVCGAGTVSFEGKCVPEDELLTADHEEAAEPNDATLAGVVTAPFLGESTSLHGCVVPDANQADQDVWVVHASEPMLLDITADGVGGLAAAFKMTSSDERLPDWQRVAVALTNDTSHRQVYLPVAGDYSLQMSSTVGLLTGTVSGSKGACYFTTVTRVPLPAPTELALPDLTATDNGNVRVLRYSATEAGAIIDMVQRILQPSAATGLVALKNGTFYGASMPFADMAYLTVGGLAPGDQVDVIVDLARNAATTEDAYALHSDLFEVGALPTDGTDLAVTKRNGSTPENPSAALNYSYFDVQTDGQIVSFELSSSEPIDMLIVRDHVFGKTGLDVVAAIDAIGSSGTDSFTGQLVRFAKAGRYYLVTQDPDGAAGGTYTLTAKLTPLSTTAVTYGTPMASQPLLANGSAFYALEVTDQRWLEVAVPAASSFSGGQARVTLYDLAGEGWFEHNYTAVQSGTQPTDGSAPLGRVVAGDPRSYLVRIEDPGASAGEPTFTLAAGERPHVLLGASTSGTPIVRTGQDTAPANGTIRYLVSGAATTTLTALATPVQVGVDIRMNRLGADESVSPGGTFDAGGSGVAESLSAPLDEAGWVPFSVTNKSSTTATALNLVVTSAAPRPYVVTTSPTVAYVDACATGSVIALSEADEAVSAAQVLPGSFANFALFGDTVGNSGVRLSSNGWMTFGAAPGPVFDPSPLPDAAAPNGVIAPFWTDLDDVELCRKDGAGTVTFQWTGVVYGRLQGVQFQVVLHDTGIIDLVYGPNHLSTTGADKEVRAGLENLLGTFGIELADALLDFGPSRSWTLTPE